MRVLTSSNHPAESAKAVNGEASSPRLGLADAHALPVERVADALATDLELGLSAAEAASRLGRDGPNLPRRPGKPKLGRILARQLVDPLVALLIGATVISILIGDLVEGIAIAAVLVLNGALGFWQELSAERAILSLSNAFSQRANVLRDGGVVEIDAADVVRGDVLIVGEGDRVAADGRVVSAHGLDADESALTGESIPTCKRADRVELKASLAEQASMVRAGTAITRGRGRVVVTATGSETALGQIETLAETAKPPPTPLERRLGQLTRQMVIAGVAVTFLLAGAMLLQGSSAEEAFLVGVAVAVAAVPEGLAATVTAALALGARAMAGRGAIVRRLEAIETLGETDVICTDKTGTLTENRIRVAGLRPAEGTTEHELLAAAILASSPREVGAAPVGDPIDRALLLAANERGLSHEEIVGARHLAHEIPFDSERRSMTVVYDEADGTWAYTKGASEVVFSHAMTDATLGDVAEAWAADGLRVIAVAAGAIEDEDDLDEGLSVVGVVALHDPLRESVPAALDVARRAGVDVLMLTGDHPATAHSIGRALGLREGAIVARATPADKLRLVQQLQGGGAIVAVTGDGINDAPALRQADVGVAMGRSGTEAAREAAAIVLTDDDFATIVDAIEEGRRIGDNIRKFVAFLLSANFGEVLVFAVAVLAGLGAPLAVVQLLLVNIATDALPALALARDPASRETMTTPPRGGAHLFTRGAWLALGLVGALVGAVTLVAFGAGHVLAPDDAQTMAFVTLAVSELALVFTLRSPRAHAWELPLNPWLVAGVLGSAAMVIAAVYVPVLHGPLATEALGAGAMLLCLLAAVVPLVAVETAKTIANRFRPLP